MRLGDILNNDRVNALRVEQNAYVNTFTQNIQSNKIERQSAEKVLFPQPYENANHYYNKQQFAPPPPLEQSSENNNHAHSNNRVPMFDVKSLLTMLMSGKFNDVLKPLMSILGGGGAGGMDVAKIFELFKPKNKTKKEEKTKNEEISSKFDDFIIIED